MIHIAKSVRATVTACALASTPQSRPTARTAKAKIGAEVQAGTLNQRTVKPPIPSIWAFAFVKRANKATHRHHGRNKVWPLLGMEARCRDAANNASLECTCAMTVTTSASFNMTNRQNTSFEVLRLVIARVAARKYRIASVLRWAVKASARPSHMLFDHTNCCGFRAFHPTPLALRV